MSCAWLQEHWLDTRDTNIVLLDGQWIRGAWCFGKIITIALSRESSSKLINNWLLMAARMVYRTAIDSPCGVTIDIRERVTALYLWP